LFAATLEASTDLVHHHAFPADGITLGEAFSFVTLVGFVGWAAASLLA
jgi:hypothetical protein